jgi:hypothetical protein
VGQAWTESICVHMDRDFCTGARRRTGRLPLSLSLSLPLCPFNVLVAGSAVFGSETPGAVIRLLRDTMAVEIAKMRA